VTSNKFVDAVLGSDSDHSDHSDPPVVTRRRKKRENLDENVNRLFEENGKDWRNAARMHLKNLLSVETKGKRQHTHWKTLGEWLVKHRKRLVGWPVTVPIPPDFLRVNNKNGPVFCSMTIEDLTIGKISSMD
jgi:hypothetical protein